MLFPHGIFSSKWYTQDIFQMWLFEWVIIGSSQWFKIFNPVIFLSLSLSVTCTLFPNILSFYIGNIHGWIRLNPTMIQQKGNHLVNNNNNFDYVSSWLAHWHWFWFWFLFVAFLCLVFFFIYFLCRPSIDFIYTSLHGEKKIVVTAACLLVNVSFIKCLHCDPLDRIHVMSFIICNLYLLQIFAIA